MTHAADTDLEYVGRRTLLNRDRANEWCVGGQGGLGSSEGGFAMQTRQTNTKMLGLFPASVLAVEAVMRKKAGSLPVQV